MPFLALPLGLVVFLATVVGDAVIGAALAGVFSVVNTVLTAYLVRHQRQLHRTLAAPRAIVYDAEGRPVGTILKLEPGPDLGVS